MSQINNIYGDTHLANELTGLIGGSGLGDMLADKIEDVKYIAVATPFGKPSDRIMTGRLGQRRVAFINRHGKGHRFSPATVPYAANIYALKKVGVHSIISTCAVGSLRQLIRPGELVIVNQIIDKTTGRISSFYNSYGAVHCEMAWPTCGRLGKKISTMTGGLEVKTHKAGTYVCMNGPQFSTRAESLMHRKWGGDLIGMTAMPEAKLAREAQICYSLVALVSDYDCWQVRHAHRGRPQRWKDKQELLREIIGNLQRASGNCLKLIEKVLESGENLTDENCGCRKSLELAVWTDKNTISAKEKKKVEVLFE